MKDGITFLINLEKNTNLEIKKYLKSTFEKQILDKIKFNNFQIEDIDDEILQDLNDKDYKNYLIQIKNRLIDNKNIKRLQEAFNTTPILKSENFYAGKILYLETVSKQIGTYRNKNSTILLSAIIGVMISILFIFVFGPLRKKR